MGSSRRRPVVVEQGQIGGVGGYTHDGARMPWDEPGVRMGTITIRWRLGYSVRSNKYSYIKTMS